MKKKKITLSVTLPKGWSDLSPAEVKRVAYYMTCGGDSFENIVSLACEFAGLLPRGKRIVDDTGQLLYMYYHRDKGNVALTSEQITAIVNALRWVSEEHIASMAAPVLDGCFTPDYRLYGVTLEQYVTADAAYHHYVNTRSIAALRTVAAVFYSRSCYDPSLLPGDVRRIARLDVDLYAVFLWFSGAKKHLASRYFYAFGSDDSTGSPLLGSDMLLGLLSTLNDGDITKNEAIKSGDLHEALYEINQKVKNSQHA